MKGRFCGRQAIVLAALTVLTVAGIPTTAFAGVAGDIGAAPVAIDPSTPTAPAVPSVPSVPIPAVPSAAGTVVKPATPAATNAKPNARVRVNVRVLATDGLAGAAGAPSCTDSFPNATTQVTRCENLPLELTAPNECNGDLVELHGTFQYFTKTVVDVAHNSMTIYEKLKWTGVYGHALNDGNPYVAYDQERTFQWSRTFALGTKTKTVTDHSEFNALISRGPDPDQYVYVRTHTVVLADFSNPLNPVLDVTFDRSAGVTCVYGGCHSSTIDP
jgi:hypothetical protein